MFKFKKFCVMAMAAAMLLTLTLTGCGQKEPTLIDLLEKATTTDSMTCKMTMDMDMTLTLFGMPAHATSKSTMDIEATQTMSHMTGTTTSTTDDETTTTKDEVYSVIGDGKITTYSREDEGDWEVTEGNYAGNASLTNAADLMQGLSMEKTDAGYVVKGQMSLIDAMASMGGMLNDPDLDFTDSDAESRFSPVDVTYTFDLKTHELKSIRMDMGAAMESMFTELMKKEMSDAFDEEGIFGDSDIETSDEDIDFTWDDEDFDENEDAEDVPSDDEEGDGGFDFNPDDFDPSTMISISVKTLTVEITDINVGASVSVTIPAEAIAAGKEIEDIG